MRKTDKEAIQKIKDAVLLCAENCYTRAQKNENAVEVIKGEYKACVDKIIELLEEGVKQ